MQQTISRFEPIALSEMDGVKLLDRTDTKFVFGGNDLEGILKEMMDEYRVLEVSGARGTDYRSLYFDTADLQHYQDHHNRRTFRSKVRFREYVGSGLAFLEVKRKNGRGGTEKRRMQVPAIPAQLTAEQEAFIAAAIGYKAPLQATLWNHFTRYTFVHRHRPERLTMDVDLRFSDAGGTRDLGDIVVAELKEERADRNSPFARIMRKRNLRPEGMSKYCVGMLLLERPVKHNAFKPVLLKLERIRRAA